MDTKSQLAQLGLFEARVPRYTSYPTAPHFNTAVGPDEARSWLSHIPQGGEISLYIHVPFCRRLCWFCACRTQGTTSDDPVVAYVDTLLSELELLRASLPGGVTLSRLHWGGGTPTLLPPASIRRLSAANDGGDNAPVTSGGMTGGEPEWRCTECGKLLGVANGNQLHIRVQKHREYLVGFPVTANCHGCGTLNKKSAC